MQGAFPTLRPVPTGGRGHLLFPTLPQGCNPSGKAGPQGAAGVQDSPGRLTARFPLLARLASGLPYSQLSTAWGAGGTPLTCPI